MQRTIVPSDGAFSDKLIIHAHFVQCIIRVLGQYYLTAALIYSRRIRAMAEMEISLGHTASHS